MRRDVGRLSLAHLEHLRRLVEADVRGVYRVVESLFHPEHVLTGLVLLLALAQGPDWIHWDLFPP